MSANLENLNFIVSLTDRMSAPMGKIMSTISGAKKQMTTGAFQMGAGVAGLAGLGLAIHAGTEKAIEFESAMADIKKVVDFPIPGTFEKLGDDLLKMSRIIPISAKGLAEIAAAGGEQGVQLIDLSEFVKTTAKMSTAFDMTARDAGDNIGKLANIYKIPIPEIKGLGDAINFLSNNSNSKARDVVDVMTRVGGMANLIGLTKDQTAALSSSMLSLGMTGETAGTGLNALLMTLNEIGNFKDKDKLAFESLIGPSAGEIMALAKTKPQDALLKLFDTISAMPKQDQATALIDLIGKDHGPKIASLVGSLDLYKKTLESVSDPTKYAGSMENEFITKSKTTANQLKLLQGHLEEIQIKGGNIFLPKIVEWTGKFNDKAATLVDTFNKWRAINPELESQLAGVGVGVAGLVGGGAALSVVTGFLNTSMGGLKMLFSGLRLGVSPLIKLFKQLDIAFAVMRLSMSAGLGFFTSFRTALLVLTDPLRSIIGATWRWTIALLANPAFWITLGIIALSAVVIAAVVYWDEWTGAVTNFANAFGQWSGIYAVVDGIKEKFNALGSWWDSFDPLGDMANGAIAADPRMAGYIDSMKATWGGFKAWLATINPFADMNFSVGSIGDGLLSSIDTIKAGLSEFSAWLAAINPFAGLNLGGGVIGDGLLAGITAIKNGFIELSTFISSIDVFSSLGFGAATAIAAIMFGIQSIQNGWMAAKLWLSTLNPFGALVFGAMSVVNWILSGITSVQSGWTNLKLFLASLNPFGGLIASAIAVVGSIIGALERIKGWWAGFKGWLSGLNPFAGIANSLNGLMAKVASLGSMKIAIPSIGSIGGGAAAGKGGLLKQISNNFGGNSSSKHTTVNVHNHGTAMSGAKLANEMALAGG